MTKADIFSLGMLSGLAFGIMFAMFAFTSNYQDVLRERYGICPEGYVRILERAGPPYCVQESGVRSWSHD